MGKKSNPSNQVLMSFGVESLPPITLPDTTFDIVEQFALALQNRDSIGMRQLIDSKDQNPSWGGRQAFINKFLGFCERMDKKYDGVFVQTVPGECCRSTCNIGARGLGVSVSTIKQNKLLWRFNLVTRQTQHETLELWLCKEFKVNHEDIPF
ncbi:MAG: hypothetical protein U0T32_15100 [Chitinophagales bacterium]